MGDEKWIALQRRCLPRALPVVTKTSSNDWLIVDERETVVATVSPETYWATNDSTTAEARAYLIAAAPGLVASLRDAVMFMEFIGKTDRPLTAAEQAWLGKAKALLAHAKERE